MITSLSTAQRAFVRKVFRARMDGRPALRNKNGYFINGDAVLYGRQVIDPLVEEGYLWVQRSLVYNAEYVGIEAERRGELRALLKQRVRG